MRRAASVAVILSLASCRFDPAYRDDLLPTAPACVEGALSCTGDKLSRCVNETLTTVDDCGARQLVCAPTLLKCTPCLPSGTVCQNQDVMQCDATGQTQTKQTTCNNDVGDVCRNGTCHDLCLEASQNKSNIGCEYWAVDLDNAVTTQGNAALQQYAVILSNPQPDVSAKVTIDEDDAQPGTPSATRTVGTSSVNPLALEVFNLGPREVDGSPPNVPNGGTGTALSRGAYRVRTNIPIVAYQFNPLDNVNVFSNDASLLLPTAALGGNTGRAYVVGSWPQTIATTSDPNTNFGTDLRAFLTIVGTAADTKVHLKSMARVIPGGPFDAGIAAGGEVDVTLQPFDVLNLETGDFNGDFTGSLIDSNNPIAVYVGTEASDAPFYTTLSNRQCCADHLEEQLTPVRAIGKNYVIGRVPNRSDAIAAAGGAIAHFDEGELYRIIATAPTAVSTTLPPPWDAFALDAEGASVTIPAFQDFTLTSKEPVLVADVQVSQLAAGVNDNSLPGGDPSITFLPSVEQWRQDNIFLTPDKYVFDFVVVTAPFGATVFLDGLKVDSTICAVADADGLTAAARKAPNPPYTVYRCQLSFPVIDPTKVPPANLADGKQHDGVHRVQSDQPVGVIVYGFDKFVSYAYAAGTDLVDINAN